MSRTLDKALARRAEKIITGAPGRVTADITADGETRNVASRRAGDPAGAGSTATRAMVARRVGRAILAGTTALTAAIAFAATGGALDLAGGSTPVTTPGGGSTPTDGPSVVAIADFSRDKVLFDRGATVGGSSALIVLTGTAGDDGLPIYARHGSSGDWLQISDGASGGTWAGVLATSSNEYAPVEVLQSDGSIVSQTTPCAAGNIIVLWGQSELHRAVLPGFVAQRDLPSINDDEALQVTYCDTTGAGWGQVSNFRHVHISDATPVTGNLNELSNMFAAERPGEKFHIVFHTQSGTGATSLMNDSDPSRQWADDMALRNWAFADGQHPGLAMQCWYNADAGILGSNYGTFWTRAITGQNPDGSAATGLDHYFSEIYDYVDETRFAIAGPQRFEGPAFSATVPAIRAALDVAFENSVLSSVTSRVLEPLAYLNGDAAGGDEAHPNRNDPDGQARLMVLLGYGALQAMGYAPATPEIDNAAILPGDAGVEVWSSAGALTTTRAARSELGTLPAGRPAAGPFLVNGAPATDVTLVGGRIRIAWPVSDGDTLDFAMGGIGTETLPDDLTINEVWKDYPLVDVGVTSVEGFPVRGRVPLTDLAGIPAASVTPDPNTNPNLLGAGAQAALLADSGTDRWKSNDAVGSWSNPAAGTLRLSGASSNDEITLLQNPDDAFEGLDLEFSFVLSSPDAASGDFLVVAISTGGGTSNVVNTGDFTPVFGARNKVTLVAPYPSGLARLELRLQTRGSVSGTWDFSEFAIKEV